MVKSILGIVPGLQATAIVGNQLKSMKGSFEIGKRGYNIKKSNRNMIRGTIGTMTGIALMKPTSTMINSL